MANITNGTVSVTITGGVGPYRYTLLNAGNLQPIPQNAYATFTNPINNVSQESITFGDSTDETGNSGLASGSYRVRVIDGNDCETISGELVVSNEAVDICESFGVASSSTSLANTNCDIFTVDNTTITEADTLVDSSGGGSGGGSGPTPTATAQLSSGGGGGQSGLAPTPTDTPVFSNIPTPTPAETPGGGLGSGIPDPTATVVPDPTATVVPDPTATPDLSVTPNPDPDPTAMPVPDPTATEVPDPTATPSQDISNLTFDYHVPLTLDGYTYGLRNENGDTFGYYEDYSLTVANPVYWSHEIFAEPYVGHKWTSTDQLVFEVDGNQIVPDGTIQNNISIVTQIESDGRLSILTKSHNINEDRVHEIRITGGPELVDGSTPIDPPVRRPMLGLTPYNAWMDLVAQWEQENPGCEYNPAFDFATVSFLQVDLLGVTNAEMHDWGLGTSGRIRFMLRVLSETRALDMDLLNEFGQSEKSGCLITPTL